MTSTPPSPHRTASTSHPLVSGPTARRSRRRPAAVLGASLLAGAVVGGLTGLAGGSPAQADEPRYETIEVCDATACLVAWKVVDSDGDGVSDADEWMAGSDPHDPSSRPPLAVLTDLLASRQLPSFENGLATMVVMPADLVELREKATGDERLGDLQLDGFPLPTRKDTLSRLGISTDLMKEHGIDVERDAFTLGLAPPSKDDGLPPIRIGGVDRSTISAGGEASKDHGAPTSTPPASTPPASTPPASTPPAPGATTPATTPGATTPSGSPGSGSGSGGGSGGGSGSGSGEAELVPLVNLNPGEPVGTQKLLGITFNHYADGTIIAKGLGQTTYYYPGGGYTTYPDKPGKHDENPDAEDATVIDPAAFERWERTAKAAERTVEGWRAPGIDGEVPDRPGTLIAWIDGDLAIDAMVVVDEPRVTTAQPEGRPDLPNPAVGAPTGGVRGGSDGCGDGYCGG